MTDTAKARATADDLPQGVTEASRTGVYTSDHASRLSAYDQRPSGLNLNLNAFTKAANGARV